MTSRDKLKSGSVAIKKSQVKYTFETPFETPQRSVKIKIYVYFFFLRDRDGKGLTNLSEYVNKLTIRLLIISGEIEINSNNGAGDRIFVNFFTSFSSVKSVMKVFVGNFVEFSLFKDFILDSLGRCVVLMFLMLTLNIFHTFLLAL